MDGVLTRYRGQKGSLIPVLQATQEIYGYLPADALRRISRELKVPLSKIYGVATFYAQFHLKPRGRNIVRVCLGTACHVRGGAKIMEKVMGTLGVEDGETTEDLRYTLESVACLGACGLSPIMMVNDDTHGRLTTEAVSKILAQYE
ncbi:NADH dehydrogenase [Clostridiales bacterium PH28_bin88]|nr:NADH dehydrogenase [Clostridiales bacterium PH28_bin88]